MSTPILDLTGSIKQPRGPRLYLNLLLLYYLDFLKQLTDGLVVVTPVATIFVATKSTRQAKPLLRLDAK